MAERNGGAELAELLDATLVAMLPTYTSPPTRDNVRAYGCSIEDCSNPAYASGLCNAHYIRSKRGADMAAPLRMRGRSLAVCVECGAHVGSAGGFGRCAKHYRSLRARTIRAVCIEALGGKCIHCRQSYPPAVFDFHHRRGTIKIDDVATLINTASIIRIAEEVSKCDLLCANCHRIEHYGT